MGDILGRIQQRAMSFYNGLDKNRRRLLLAGIALIVLLLTVGILFFTRTEYVEIARGLTVAEAQVITSTLDDLGISWQDAENTSVILVPKADASRARMEIAATGAAGTFSWSDIFNNESITMTSQTREQMYIQALAADIEQSIETINGVEDAAVILQIPKESNYFLAEDIKSRASVVLTLRSGVTLDEQKVSGIVNLIVSAVSDLVPENVTILDSDGNQLNDQSALDSFSANSNYELQIQIQDQLKHDLEGFLEKIYGVGNVEVRPALTLDFNQQTETQTLFSPPIDGSTEGLPRSISKITENVVNGTGAVGTPGTDSNSTTTSTVEVDSTNSTYEKASETLNYELNEIYREIVKSQGDVVSMSIGVLINSNALVDGVITDDHYTELLNLIAKSAGTSTDNITIFTQAFPDPMENYDVYTGQDTAGMLFGIPIWAIALVVIVTLAIVVAVLLVMRRNRTKREQEAQALRDAEMAQQNELEEIGGDLEDKSSPKYHIEKFVDTNPEAAAALLRAWLNE